MISPILIQAIWKYFGKEDKHMARKPWKKSKGQAGFKGYHSTMDHLIILRIIAEERQNNKTNLLCCFIDFRKAFDIVPRTNLWYRLKEIKVPFG